MRKSHATRLALTLSAVLGAAAWTQAQGVTVGGLEVNGSAPAVGIDDRAPRLSWQLHGTRRAIRQTAYRVVVSTSRSKAHAGQGDVWDSGRVASSDPWTTYAGPALASRTQYHWSVRVWTDADSAGATSALPARFETAYLDASEWKGAWIAGPVRTDVRTPAAGAADDAAIRAAQDFCRPPAWIKGFAADRFPNDQGECRELRPAPMLRRAFQVTKPVARARIYSSGLAYRALQLNSAPVSDRCARPGVHGLLEDRALHDRRRDGPADAR
jgi:alpha-L-rhamnosidase